MIWEGQWGRKEGGSNANSRPLVPLLWQEKQTWEVQNGSWHSWKSALPSPELLTEVDTIPTLDVKTPHFRKLRNCLLFQCKHHCWRAWHWSHCDSQSLWFNAWALRRILLARENVYINMKCCIYCIKYFLVKTLIIGNFKTYVQFSSVQSLSRVQLFATPWITARQASLFITNSQSSLKLMSIESVMPSSRLILCCPFSSCPQSLPASGSFPMSQLFASDSQSIGASASVIPMKIQIQHFILI